jgi:hypothetical protein
MTNIEIVIVKLWSLKCCSSSGNRCSEFWDRQQTFAHPDLPIIHDAAKAQLCITILRRGCGVNPLFQIIRSFLPDSICADSYSTLELVRAIQRCGRGEGFLTFACVFIYHLGSPSALLTIHYKSKQIPKSFVWLLSSPRNAQHAPAQWHPYCSPHRSLPTPRSKTSAPQRKRRSAKATRGDTTSLSANTAKLRKRTRKRNGRAQTRAQSTTSLPRLPEGNHKMSSRALLRNGGAVKVIEPQHIRGTTRVLGWMVC